MAAELLAAEETAHTVCVTIAVDKKSEALAVRWAKLVQERTSMPVYIMTNLKRWSVPGLTSRFERICSMKFSVFEYLDRRGVDYNRVMYADLNWLPLGPVDIDALCPDLNVLYMTRDCISETDPGHAQELTRKYKLVKPYMNAGWMLAGRRVCASRFSAAREAYSTYERLYYDQCVFNQALRDVIVEAPRTLNDNQHSRRARRHNPLCLQASEVIDMKLEGFSLPERMTLTDDEVRLFQLDYSHERTTAWCHILEIYREAKRHPKGCRMLEVNSQSHRAHVTLALCLAGGDVTYYDIDTKFREERARHLAGFKVTARNELGTQELFRPGRFRVIFYDLFNGDRAIVEVKRFFWQKLEEGGVLMVHNINALDHKRLLQHALRNCPHRIINDSKGRQLGFFFKTKMFLHQLIVRDVAPYTSASPKKRFNLLQQVDRVLDLNLPGDFVEVGVGKGGMCLAIALRLRQRGVRDRKVWAVDTFNGMTAAVTRYGKTRLKGTQLAIAKFNLGYYISYIRTFRTDIRQWEPPCKSVALLRCDTDHANSTQTVLNTLYPRLAPTGACIIGNIRGVKDVVDLFVGGAEVSNKILRHTDSTERWWLKGDEDARS